MTDITTTTDVKLMVDSFYNKVKEDPLLSPVFASRIKDHEWPSHLLRLYDFWNAILFAEKGFSGNPMQKHLHLPIGEQHFSQWLLLFNETVDKLFSGPKAVEAKQRAASIARLIQFKITSMRA